MVLAFTLSILGCSTLLLAAASKQQVRQHRCPVPHIKNGRRAPSRYVFWPGDAARFTCNAGYTLQGSHISVCQADFSWSPPLPACKKGVMCPQPPNIANGLHSGQSMDKVLPGAVVNYSCKDGFELVGNVSISCSEAGRWSRPLPRCQAIGCQSPTVHNGKLQAPKDTYEAGEMLWFDCNPGYAVEGSHWAQCQPGGSWDPPVLRCERVQPCPVPPRISNGDHDGHGTAEFTMGMYVTYTCNLGYYLAGNVERVFCKASGKWSQPSPRCEEVTCPQPPNIANGLHSGRSSARFRYGTVVYYSCKDGFELVGNVSTSCSEVGRWSRPLPRCQAIGCQSPTVHNGKLQAPRDTYEAGEMLQFDCNPGYAAEGSHRARCQPGGSWDPPVLRCQRVRPCPMPPKISNGDHNRHGEAFFTAGMSVTYSCDPTFYLVGNAHVVCRASGTWSQPSPRCEATICLKPDIQDGWIVDDQGLIYAPGQMVTFKCQEGYSLQGSAKALCQENGSWDPPVPLCEPLHSPTLPRRADRSGGCGVPTRLTFAELNEEHRNEIDFSVGKTVGYTCRPGFAKHPGMSPTITCLQGGVWSEALEFCKRKECNYPEAPQNGRVVVLTDLLFRSIVNYTCEEGYRLVGQSLRRCELSGADIAWSGDAPTCQKVVCPVPQIQNGRVSIPKQRYRYKDTVSFQCHEGFVLKGHSMAQCKADKTWDPPVPICEQVVKCLPPPSIINGEHSHFSDTFGVGAIVHYRCKPGFFLTGNESIRCTPHGVWSRPLPRCEAGCVSPGIGHGKVIGWEPLYMPGNIITIECNTDNISKVLHKSQCRPGGTWFPPFPACDGVLHCSKPPDILHGGHSGLGKAVFTPGTSVNYSCETGFSLIGMASIYCTESGAWSHPSPVCQVVKCLHPPAITNGKLQGNTSDTFFYGVSVSYSCDSGYSLTGDAFITCTASGTWSPPPQCKEISCVFPEVQGVKKTTAGKTYRFGTNITLECDDGYTLEGLSQIQCQENFSWDPPVPACKLTSPRSGSVGLGIAAAVVLLLLGVTIGWKIISKKKEGYYRTYENYNYKTSLD